MNIIHILFYRKSIIRKFLNTRISFRGVHHVQSYTVVVMTFLLRLPFTQCITECADEKMENACQPIRLRYIRSVYSNNSGKYSDQAIKLSSSHSKVHPVLLHVSMSSPNCCQNSIRNMAFAAERNTHPCYYIQCPMVYFMAAILIQCFDHSLYAYRFLTNHGTTRTILHQNDEI